MFPSTAKQSRLKSGLWEELGRTTTPMSALTFLLDPINRQIIYNQWEESLQLITSIIQSITDLRNFTCVPLCDTYMYRTVRKAFTS